MYIYMTSLYVRMFITCIWRRWRVEYPRIPLHFVWFFFFLISRKLVWCDKWRFNEFLSKTGPHKRWDWRFTDASEFNIRSYIYNTTTIVDGRRVNAYGASERHLFFRSNFAFARFRFSLSYSRVEIRERVSRKCLSLRLLSLARIVYDQRFFLIFIELWPRAYYIHARK